MTQGKEQANPGMFGKVKSAFSQYGKSYKRMLSLAKTQWKILVYGTIFLALGSGLGLAAPQMIRLMVDGALEQGMESINKAAGLLLVLFFFQGIAVGFRFYLYTLAGQRIVCDLRAQTYRKIMEQDIGFFDERKTGELINRLASDTQVLQSTVTVNVSMVLRNLAMAVGCIILLIYTSPSLAGLMLLLVPPVVVASLLGARPLRRLSRLVQDSLARAGEVATETISGVRTVRAFARESRESRRYDIAVEDAYNAMRDRTRFMAYFQAILTMAGYVAVALVLWYGGRLVVEGSISVGELTSFIIYTLLLAVSLGTLGSLFTDFVSAAGAAERLFELLDGEPEVSLTGGKQLPVFKGYIEFDGVHFSYPTRSDQKALEDVSFTINPGEMVALVGPSGSGKSTIAALLSRFYEPGEGVIRFDQVPLTELDATWVRKQVGIVSQEPILFSTSIGENIAYGADACDEEQLRGAAEAANALEFIETFKEGFDTPVGERGVRLSGGQKQRIAIARALLKDPKILILDEATSALDATSEHLVKQALERLMKSRTSIVIAHRLSTVMGADRVLVLDQGRIVESGTHDDLVAKDGIYRQLVQRQFLHLPDAAES